MIVKIKNSKGKSKAETAFTDKRKISSRSCPSSFLPFTFLILNFPGG
jgi:hypothetical protein